MASTGSPACPEDVRSWGLQRDEVARRIGARFPRSETRDRVRAYLAGLLGPVQRKDAWQVAEQIGDGDPYGVQYLMGRADWDPDAVRDDLRGYVVGARGGPDAVSIGDETGSLKKGTRSAGVARQDTGTAGRIEDAQVGAFPAYASRHGTAFLDRAPDLPQEWTDDPARCQEAGIPEGTAFATKIRPAKLMLERAFAAGVPAAWVSGDEVYGAWELRRWLEGEKRPYVLGVRGNRDVTVGWRQVTAAALAAGLPKRSWRDHGRRGQQGASALRLGVGGDQPRPGAEVAAVVAGPQGARRARRAGLLRRGRPGPHDVDPAGQDRRDPVGGRGRVRVGQAGGRAGRLRGAELDRLAPPRHLVPPCPRRLGRGPEAGRRPAEKESGGAPELIRLTVPEVRRLLVRPLWSRLPEADEVPDWSGWRCAHQAFARRCHYRRRGAETPD